MLYSVSHTAYSLAGAGLPRASSYLIYHRRHRASHQRSLIFCITPRTVRTDTASRHALFSANSVADRSMITPHRRKLFAVALRKTRLWSLDGNLAGEWFRDVSGYPDGLRGPGLAFTALRRAGVGQPCAIFFFLLKGQGRRPNIRRPS